ncbi:MAG: hypothetical protein AAFV53_36315, partial [Myxococcota bacterium]
MSGPAELYENFLKAEGYIPQVDGDGDVVFKKEGTTFFIDIAENDPEYFRIVCPNFWSIDNEEERARALHSSSRATARGKVAKVFLVRDNTWASVEQFVAQPEDFKGIFDRSMSALQNGIGLFVEEMRKANGEGEGEGEG